MCHPFGVVETVSIDFMGLDFLAGPEALIPQKETELLAGVALELLGGLVPERGQATVLDLCTGSGNLAVTLACREKNCRVYATDLSEQAVSLARKNAAHLRVGDRVEILAGDLFAPLARLPAAAQADLIVCNPPYISSRKVDTLPPDISRRGPRLAFDGGPFGLTILSRLIKESSAFLRPASFLCFEVGAGQGAGLLNLMRRMPAYAEVRPVSDADGAIRVLIGRTPSAAAP
jgi:release factor glutamine methyltransferase